MFTPPNSAPMETVAPSVGAIDIDANSVHVGFSNDEIEVLWQMSVAYLPSNNNEMVIPKYLAVKLSEENINVLKVRFSDFFDHCATEVVVDHVAEVFRIRKAHQVPAVGNSLSASCSLPSPSSSPESLLSASDPYDLVCSGQNDESGKEPEPARAIRLPGKKSKVPRPPNAFILYRQKHHPLVKAANPYMKNNDISILLGQQWKAESESIKAQFKALAEKMKVKHAAENPGYQYAPRKASEKKRRMTVRKLARLRLNDADSDAQSKADTEMGGVQGHQHFDTPDAGPAQRGARASIGSTQLPLPAFALPSSASEILGTERASYPSHIQPNGDKHFSLNIPTGHTQVEHDYLVKMADVPGAHESDDFLTADAATITFDENGRATVSMVPIDISIDYDAGLIDYEGVQTDVDHFIRSFPNSLIPIAEEIATTEPAASIVGFDDENERLAFQEQLDEILWMYE